MTYKYDTTIPSSKFLKSRVIKLDGVSIVDMRGDTRLDVIENLVRDEIGKRGWKVPENEKDICKKISELMHKKEFYGEYNTKSAEIQNKLNSLQWNISSIKLNKHNPDFVKRSGGSLEQLEKKLDGLEKKERELNQNLTGDTVGRNTKALKDVKSGETVCFYQAAIMSYLMGKAGISNDLCLGITGAEISNGHAFVQSHAKGNAMVDPTTDVVYWYNETGGKIRNNEFVIASEILPGNREGGESRTYGGGKFPTLSELKHADKYLLEMLANIKTPILQK